MMPPVPPMHHPPGHPTVHPNEAPRVFHPQTSTPIDPTHLADEMARLRMNVNDLAAGNDQKTRSFTPHKDFEVRVPAHYVGYTFFKADVPAGQKPTWSHVERTRMHLTQLDLAKIVQRRGKKLPSAQQYQALKKPRRTHVDQLINEHRQSDPRFEWTCVYVNEEERPFKGKNSRWGDYETVSMDVILMRKPMDTANLTPKTPNMGAENSGLPFTAKDKPTTNVEELLARDEPKQVNRDFMKSASWAMPGMQQGQTPGMVHHAAQQQLPPQFQQQMPPHAQLNHPQANLAGARPQVNQAHQNPLQQGMAAGVHQQPHHQQSQFHDNAKSVPSKGPEIEILQHGMGGFPAGMNMNMNAHRQAQGHNPAQNPFGQPLNQQCPGKENFAHRVNTAQGGMPAQVEIPRQGGIPHQGGIPGHGTIPAHAGIQTHRAVPTHAAIPRAPNAPEAEPEWGPETSSIGDDESIIFDDEDVSSITDGSEEEEGHEGDADLHGKGQPWRGSLFRRHSSKSRRQEPVYRTHYRKHSKNGMEARNGRTKYPAGYIDVVPAESKNSSNRLSKVHAREVARPSRDRPKIIHSASDNLDMVAFDEKYRGLRARNDIRTRILDDREARVERREKLVDYRTQMLDDRLDEARYLDRRMSLRERGPYYPRGYYLRDDL
ncbi:hypothetical protein P170DRAFT_440581 [Aspergillus steynii IBT 23096]|uniref:Uncharacterized protein n=1 Tax=Aspergillus steynii IBT 23096 TaxID=1392250 RepID=A0A2I2FUF1_9EURO|nr:uncharacterized protein P170DRAFT_440581 [Aspergillus steynii IBT 23096]PLB44270.1 hypothetical protein P170DRAFT_440581 [Aspergillus steynii IBT 23096]